MAAGAGVTLELQAAAEVVAILRGLGLPVLVGGSVASSVYGVPRTTHDVDIVTQFELSDVDALLRALGARYYQSREAIEEAVTMRTCFNLIDYTTMLKIDIFVLGDSAFARAELEGVRDLEVDRATGMWLPLPRVEDLIVQKLAWFEEGGRVADSQWRDVLGMLRVQRAALDLARLADLAELRDVGVLARLALVEAGIVTAGLFE
jgi:hypothetical protein